MEDETYVLISDSNEVPALFKIEDNLEQIRINGEWTDPTAEQIGELDGLLVATITEEFVPVYDEIQASQKTATRKDLEGYVK
jgi:hypothetical protein